MNMDTRILDAEKEYDIKAAGEILRRGGLVAIPTETVYGLAGNALDPTVSTQIYAVKGRPSDNPLIVHITSMEELPALVTEIPEAARKLAEAFWPGPLTIIMKKSALVPKETTGGLDTVAVRMPSHPAARAIIRAAGVPLAAPSANLSGLPSPTAFVHVCDDLNGRVDAIVDGGDCAVGVESTVITVVTEVPRVLRPGGVSVEQLRAVLGRVDVDRAVLEKPAENARVSSPGMKYKHYAPKAEITIVDAAFEDYAAFVNAQPGAAALCFEGEEKALSCPCVPYGRAEDALSQAHCLFAALHTLDEIGAKIVYARMPRKAGVGLAVYNRLIRASAFRVLVPRDEMVVGLTGQTGAGKSTVSKRLAERGCAVIDCDAVTRDPALYGGACLKELQKAFGRDIIGPDGCLNRRLLANRAFADEASAATLNRITHPVILGRLRAEIDARRAAGAKIIVLDAPTLFEAGADCLCRRVVSVIAGESVRLARIVRRDGLTEVEAKRRMRAQHADAFYTERSDFVLDNTESVSETELDTMLAALGCAHQGEED
ncbi:MAG: L-threonylcarbamoyladenylate synthase [Hominenteromicrobium sp.]